jgi:hypothetical protein
MITLSQIHKNLNIIEPYIAYYDAGVAYLRSGNGKSAEAELQDSVHHNPPADKICQVRTNLSYSIEIQADEAKVKKKYDEALVLYSRAEGVLYENDCAAKQSSRQSKDQKAETAKTRISQKRSDTVAMMNGNYDDNTENNDDNGLEITEEDAEKIREKLLPGSDIRNSIYDKMNNNYSNRYDYVQHW